MAVKQSTVNYEVIKQSAKASGVKVNEFLALAPANDPFYTGTPSDNSRGRWFKEQWDRLGFIDGVHLRRVHYALQASGEVELPSRVGWTNLETGKKEYTDVYVNNEACWRFLVGASKAARYLGLVDAAAFVDRRNPDAIIYNPVPDPESYDFRDPTPRAKIAAGWKVKSDPTEDWWEDDDERFALPDLPELDNLPDQLPQHPRLDADGYIGTPQKHLLYIFAEKSTMDDVLKPLCEQYRVNYVRGLGEMSITSVIDYLSQVSRHGRPSRILYISDYDPAGIGMPISVARKIEFYLSLLEDEGHDIALKPIVLTQEQIDQYNLPSAPVKESDKRKKNFESSHGLATELDALEALHPGELRNIVEAEILKYYDPHYDNALWGARRRLQSILDQQTQSVIDEYNKDGVLTELDEDYEDIYDRWQDIRQDFDLLVEDFQGEIEDFRLELESLSKRTSEAHEEIREEMRAVDAKAPAVPTPTLPDEDDDELLFNSTRDYLEQLENYKRHRMGT
jgi:hypothetical protein